MVASTILNAKSALGRADLLRAFAQGGQPALDQLAFDLGYERTVRDQAEHVTQPRDPGLDFTIVSDPPPVLPPRPAQLPIAKFFAVTARTIIRDPREGGPQPPEWLRGATAYTDDVRPEPRQVRLPRREPLVRWSRLWPALRRELGQTRWSRRPDIPRLIERITRGEVVRDIPRDSHTDWSTRLCLLLDCRKDLIPFWDDGGDLMRALERLRGRHGVEVRIIEDLPSRQVRYYHPREATDRPWQMPAPQTPVLIVSDFGAYSVTDEAAYAWQQFVAHLGVSGCPTLALSPVPESKQARISRKLRVLEWDRGSHLKPVSERGKAPPSADAATETLLALLSPAVNIEWRLLRGARYLLPATQAPVSAEAILQRHPAVDSGGVGFRIKTTELERYQNGFAALDPALQAQAIALIQAQHGAEPESIRRAELANCARLAPAHFAARDTEEIETWQRNMVQTVLQQHDASALSSWAERHTDRQTSRMWQDNRSLAALWALAQREALERGEPLELPPGVRQEEVEYFLRRAGFAQPQPCQLRQIGPDLVLVPGGQSEARAPGSWFADLTLHTPAIYARDSHDTDEENLAAPWRHQTFAGEVLRLATLDRAANRIELRTEHESFVIAGFSKPAWAQSIGRDVSGLFAEVLWRGNRVRLAWEAPMVGKSQGQWRSNEQPVGVDDDGLYADLIVAGAIQRFRWIVPGRFLMGSPEDEAERSDNEVQHEVRLSTGYWLADTACTQAFWGAITDKNPSHFATDPSNPVEQVSWEDVRGFLDRLNQLAPGLQACLPSEAQWEYACRAGTTAPFSFGQSVTPAEVNYDGNVPYAGGAEGLYRERTVAVRTLPASPWGLYEMLGNVWEWCADWLDDYAVEPQIDPVGPRDGASRVLRGGSWINGGRDARSAGRTFWGVPGLRIFYVGFRLALGQGEQVPGAAPAERARGTRGGEDGGPRAEKQGVLARVFKRLKRK